MYTRKITVALALTLVCLVLLLSASYAWYTMSLRPEVNGIETNIGANGSLEIALLDGASFVDPTLIRSKPGDSAVEQDLTLSNLSWGNVVDLSDESYGLSDVSLYPARLNLTQNSNGSWSVENNILLYAEYGFDGRISELYDETVSGVFADGRYRFTMSGQEYGVRGIGAAEGLKLQQTALLEARTAIATNANSAKRMIESAWQKYGDAVIDVYYRRYCPGDLDGYDAYTQEDRANMHGMLKMTLQAYEYVDAMIRQYLIGYAATVVEDSSQFQSVSSLIRRTENLASLRKQLGMYFPEIVSVLNEYETLYQTMEDLRSGISSMESEPEGDLHFEDIRYGIEPLLMASECYLNGFSMDEFAAYSELGFDNILRVGYHDSSMSEICKYIGSYEVFFQWNGTTSIEVVAAADPDYYSQPLAEQFEAGLADKRPAGGYNVTSGSIRDVCGFAIDLAFRCNKQANLLLQTDAQVRVDNGSEGELLQGGGSYMKFTSEELDTNQMILLMDGIRIAFLDGQGQLLGLAKLNTSNYEESKDGVSAPLYLYDYQLSDQGIITLGQRQEKNGLIMELYQNTAAVMTAVIWLDGDYVDNSYAATSGMSITGSLNLQFATDAQLVASSDYINAD